MTTDFNYNNKTIDSNGPIKPSGIDQPGDPRTRVKSYSDIELIPNPYLGMIITVEMDETNQNKMTDYKVVSLKANTLGIANTVIDRVQRYVEYLGVSTGGSVDLSGYATKDELNSKANTSDIPTNTSELYNDSGFLISIPSEYVTETEMNEAIANISSGGSVSQEEINTAINNYFTEHPVSSGATAEQVAQIQANKTAIGDANSGLIKEVNNIKNTELQNLNTAIQTLETLVGVDETVGDKSGLPSGDANVIASINRIDNKPSGTVTDEQISTAINNYLTEHPVSSGATAEQAAQIETNKNNIVTINNVMGSETLETTSTTVKGAINELKNITDSKATEDYVNQKISEASLSGSSGISFKDVTDGEIFSILKTYADIFVSETSLSVNENSSTTFMVKLMSRPSVEQIVGISINNGNCSVDKSTLVFNSSNYSDLQIVTVSGTHISSDYENKNSIITLSSENISSKTIEVSILNIDTEKILESISATYNQGDTLVYANTPLNNLKNNLTVLAIYNDGSSEEITDYVLSGTLSVGNSEITVTYNEKTAKFNVVVSDNTSDVMYNITRNLTNVTSNKSDISIKEGSAYNEILTPNEGYILSEVTVSMNGTDITSDSYSDGVINILNVSGDISITAIAVNENTNSSIYATLETIDGNEYLALKTERLDDGTPANQLTVSEKTNYKTDLYRFFSIGHKSVLLNNYMDGNLINNTGVTSETNFNVWRSNSCDEESIIPFNSSIYFKIKSTNISEEISMPDVLKYINNNILKHDKLRFKSKALYTLNTTELISHIGDSSTVSTSTNGNFVYIQTNYKPFAADRVGGVALLTNYDWSGKPTSKGLTDAGVGVTSVATGAYLNIGLPIDKFTSNNLELNIVNVKNVLMEYYSDLIIYSFEALIK